MVGRQLRFALARAATAGVCSGMLRRPEIDGRVGVVYRTAGSVVRARTSAGEGDREGGRERECERDKGGGEETRSVHV